MKKITYSQLRNMFFEHNRKSYRKPITAVIVFDQSNWATNFSVEQRSYRVSSESNGFYENKISNAIFGDCLDGRDLGIRLDWYNWNVEYCYIEE